MLSPGSISRFSSASALPISNRIFPFHRKIVSSLTLWYCRLSAWPAFTCSTFPTYRSVLAQCSSCPQGLSTLVTLKHPPLCQRVGEILLDLRRRFEFEGACRNLVQLARIHVLNHLTSDGNGRRRHTELYEAHPYQQRQHDGIRRHLAAH